MFWGHFYPPPPISDFPPILKAFLHRDSPIFENLPPPSLKWDIIYGRPLSTRKIPASPAGVNISTWKGKLFPRSFFNIRNSTQTIFQNSQVFKVKPIDISGTLPKFLKFQQTVSKSNFHVLIDLFTPAFCTSVRHISIFFQFLQLYNMSQMKGA